MGGTLDVGGPSTLASVSVPGTSTLADINVPAPGILDVLGTATFADIDVPSAGPSPGTLDVGGTSTLHTLSVGTGGITVSPGNINTGSHSPTANYIVSSDRRLKTRLVSIDDALEKALTLKGVYFSWTKNAKIRNLSDTSSARRQIGFIAQDVMDIVPEAVSEIDDDGYLGVNYNALVSLLVEAMRELNEKVNHLQVELDKLSMISSNREEEDEKVDLNKNKH